MLSALPRYPDVFACGADYYGVAELTAFAEDTHKFESRYLDWLIDRSDWAERSPLAHADNIRAPVIVLQGDEDRVVPPSQSEVIVAALERNGIDHESSCSRASSTASARRKTFAALWKRSSRSTAASSNYERGTVPL